jgi:hypothetical protein
LSLASVSCAALRAVCLSVDLPLDGRDVARAARPRGEVGELALIVRDGRLQRLDLPLQIGHGGLGVRVLLGGGRVGVRLLGVGALLLHGLELHLRGGQRRRQLGRVHRAVLVVDGQGVVVGVARLLHVVARLGRGVGQREQALLVVDLLRLEVGLGLLELVGLLLLEREEHVARRDGLPDLDHDGGDLARLADRDVVDLVRAHGAAAADLGVDRAGLGRRGRRLGQGAVHDRLREEGQHEQHRQEDDRGGLDPFSFFDLCFHIDNPPAFRKCLADPL